MFTKPPEATLTKGNIDVRSLSRAHSIYLTETFVEHDDVLKILDVEKNPRYTPTETQTFCNIYVHDFARLLGIYIPRVWWTQETIKKQDYSVVSYGKNVLDLNVNAIYDWFNNYGTYYNWTNVGKDELIIKNFSNVRNKLVVILAKNKDPKRSGHATIVLSRRDNPNIVQSQAGRNNIEEFSSEWYKSTNYSNWSAFAITLPENRTKFLKINPNVNPKLDPSLIKEIKRKKDKLSPKSMQQKAAKNSLINLQNKNK